MPERRTREERLDKTARTMPGRTVPREAAEEQGRSQELMVCTAGRVLPELEPSRDMPGAHSGTVAEDKLVAPAQEAELGLALEAVVAVAYSGREESCALVAPAQTTPAGGCRPLARVARQQEVEHSACENDPRALED